MNQITPEQATLIENNPIAFATVDGNGNPNVIGVAFVKVANDHQVVITDNYMSQTRENIQSNPHICLAVWNSEWKGCKIIGTAEYLTTGKWKSFVEKMPENEWLPAKAAILVTVSQIIKLG